MPIGHSPLSGDSVGSPAQPRVHDVLGLPSRRCWYPRTGSNRRTESCKDPALPLSYSGMVDHRGFEPRPNTLQECRSPTKLMAQMVRLPGFEPGYPRVSDECLYRTWLQAHGRTAWIRTRIVGDISSRYSPLYYRPWVRRRELNPLYSVMSAACLPRLPALVSRAGVEPAALGLEDPGLSV